MAVLSQGSQVFFLDPADGTVVAVDCATAFNPGGAPADQIETTCLESHTREYVRGLRTPGAATLTVNFDPSNESHVRLFELSQDDSIESIQWALGWSDGDEPPTADAVEDDFVLPDTRTWYTFSGYLSDVPFDVASNSVVTSEVSIQRTGPAALIPKGAAA